MIANNDAPEREEIEALLPWFAVGTLSRSEAQRVEKAIANDRELAQRYELVREELAETIRLNETLGAPSARAMARLFERIDAEVPAARRSGRPVSAAVDLATRVSEFIAGLSPRTLAWSGAIAVFAIILQAGIITGVLLSDRGGQGGFRTVGIDQSAPAGEGAVVLLRFAPQASAADITKFLDDNKATIVGGPAPGTGLFRVRVAPGGLPKEDLARIVRQMQENKVVGLAVPAQ